jgi:uncharacterized protein
MDAPTGLCTGCWRTTAEIVNWGAMNDEGKQHVWALIDQRRVAMVFDQTPKPN